MLFLSLPTALNSPLRVEPMGVVLPLGGPRLRDPGLRIVSNDGTEGHDIDFFIYLLLFSSFQFLYSSSSKISHQITLPVNPLFQHNGY